MAKGDNEVGIAQQVGDAWALFESGFERSVEKFFGAPPINTETKVMAVRSLEAALEAQLVLRHLCRVLMSKGLVTRAEIDQCVVDALKEGAGVSPFSVSFFP